jgi:hypothetical protein
MPPPLLLLLLLPVHPLKISVSFVTPTEDKSARNFFYFFSSVHIRLCFVVFNSSPCFSAVKTSVQLGRHWFKVDIIASLF